MEDLIGRNSKGCLLGIREASIDGCWCRRPVDFQEFDGARITAEDKFGKKPRLDGEGRKRREGDHDTKSRLSIGYEEE